MDMVLRHLSKREDGILGDLQSDDMVSFRCATLEHAYTDERGGFEPKLGPGLYKCVRGEHRLLRGQAFETFEITGVIGHKDILFHVGNFNNDSEGCVLLGEAVQGFRGSVMIRDSKATFDRFMKLQAGVLEFTLTVIDYPTKIGIA